MTATGFQHTEVGVFPSDWKAVTIGELGPISKGKGISRAECRTGIIPCVRYGELYTDHDNYVKSFRSYISKEVASTSRKLQYGELLFAGSGETKEEIGKCVAFIDNCEAYAGGDIVIVTPDLDKYDPLFLGFLMNDSYVVRQKALRGQGDAVVHITGKTLSTVQLVVPPTIDEQRKIAKAMSDIDGLIDSLTKLIDKKKDIKIGTMQQLLTGEKRLAGVSEEWEKVLIGDLGKTYNGLSGKSAKDFGHGGARYITFLNVLNNPIINTTLFENVDVKPEETQNAVKKGDLLFNTSSETPSEVGICAAMLEEVDNLYLNSFCFGFRPTERLDPLYMSYWFRSSKGRELMTMLAQGSTRYNLSKDNMMKSIICIPSKEEQVAIASILTDMDTEIASLEAKKEKFELIKKGMMQELLTGRVRLV